MKGAFLFPLVLLATLGVARTTDKLLEYKHPEGWYSFKYPSALDQKSAKGDSCTMASNEGMAIYTSWLSNLKESQLDEWATKARKDTAAKATVGAIEKIKMGGGPARQYTFAMTNMGVKLKGILVCGTKGSRSVVLSMAVPENKWSHEKSKLYAVVSSFKWLK